MAPVTKLVLLVLLAAAVAEASIYRTTITTYETIDSNDDQSRRCQRETMKFRLDECRDFMKKGRSAYLIMGVAAVEEDVPKECCSQLQDVSEDCRCKVINKMMQDMQQEGGYGRGSRRGEQMPEEMVRRAELLPSKCGMGPARCPIQVARF